MLRAPPSNTRPTWKTATTFLPNAAESGSTSVSCWLSPFRYGSREACPAPTPHARPALAVAADSIEAVDGRDVVAAAAEDGVADAVGRLQPVRPGASAHTRGGGHRGSQEQEGEAAWGRPLQRLPPGPPGAPSLSSRARNG